MSRKEHEKAIDATKSAAAEAKNKEDKLNAAAAQNLQQQAAAQEFQSTINRSLDETRENVRKSIDEAKSQIPRHITAVKNYQE